MARKGCVPCSQKKSTPLGNKSGNPNAQRNKEQRKAPINPPAKTRKSQSPPPLGMQGNTQKFVLEGRDGSRQTFGSRLEADAERVRKGGGTVR